MSGGPRGSGERTSRASARRFRGVVDPRGRRGGQRTCVPSTMPWAARRRRSRSRARLVASSMMPERSLSIMRKGWGSLHTPAAGSVAATRARSLPIAPRPALWSLPRARPASHALPSNVPATSREPEGYLRSLGANARAAGHARSRSDARVARVPLVVATKSGTRKKPSLLRGRLLAGLAVRCSSPPPAHAGVSCAPRKRTSAATSRRGSHRVARRPGREIFARRTSDPRGFSSSTLLYGGSGRARAFDPSGASPALARNLSPPILVVISRSPRAN